MNTAGRIVSQLAGGVAAAVVGGTAGSLIGALLGDMVIGNYETGGLMGAFTGLALGSSFGVMCGGWGVKPPVGSGRGRQMLGASAGAILFLSAAVWSQLHELPGLIMLVVIAPVMGGILGFSLVASLEARKPPDG
jgi:hypothetical protein